MTKYKISFEARKRNAIGAFFTEIVIVDAEDVESAKRAAMQVLHAEGFETRFPIGCQPVIEGERCLQFMLANGMIDTAAMQKHNRERMNEFLRQKYPRKK